VLALRAGLRPLTPPVLLVAFFPLGKKKKEGLAR